MSKPRKKAADRRSVLIVVRVTKVERAILRKQAKADGVSFSVLMRSKLLG